MIEPEPAMKKPKVCFSGSFSDDRFGFCTGKPDVFSEGKAGIVAEDSYGCHRIKPAKG